MQTYAVGVYVGPGASPFVQMIYIIVFIFNRRRRQYNDNWKSTSWEMSTILTKKNK